MKAIHLTLFVVGLASCRTRIEWSFGEESLGLDMRMPPPDLSHRFDLSGPPVAPVWGNPMNVNLATGNLPAFVVVGDFNRDGVPDLAIDAGDNLGPSALWIFMGHGDGSFDNGVAYKTNGSPEGICAADFNGDGFADIAYTVGGGIVTRMAGPAGVLGNEQFTPANRGGFFVSCTDLNGDGRVDVAVTNPSSITVLFGRGDGALYGRTDYEIPGTSNTGCVTAADLDGDGRVDLAVATFGNPSPPGVAIFHGSGDGAFVRGATTAVGKDPYCVVAGDIDENGTMDLAVAEFSDDTVSVLPGNGDGSFRPQISYKVGHEPDFLALGDLNGDGLIDVAVPDFSGVVLFGEGDVQILLGGPGHLVPQPPIKGEWRPAGITIADLNGDARNDLIVVDRQNDRVVVLLNVTP